MIIGSSELRSLARRVAMVDGGFDPLHAGHVAYFRQAAALGLPVLCNMRGDSYLTTVKGRPNLLPEAQRAMLIDALEPVAYVHVCNTTTADVLERLTPALYVKGADWRGRLPQAELELCNRRGIEVRYIDFTVECSSSALVESFLDRTVEMANAQFDGDEQPPRRSVTIEEAGAPVPDELAACAEPAALHGARPYRYVVTSHSNRYLSGVAKFSHLLAERLSTPCLPLDAATGLAEGPILLSLKVADAAPEALPLMERSIRALRDNRVAFDVFFHSFDGRPVELVALSACRHAFAGNTELADRIRVTGYHAEALWCPALIDRESPARTPRLSIFSFGMAHKVQVEYYSRLKQLLDGSGIDYELRVSTAFHEKASFGDIDQLERRFRDAFQERIRLLGFLSDASVNHFLAEADLFCAFFSSGVRANNTSVHAALEAGVPLLTNTDRYSPSWMRHGQNMFDIGRLERADLEPDRLAMVGTGGQRAVSEYAGWDSLVHRLAERSRDRSAGAHDGSPGTALTDDAEAGTTDVTLAAVQPQPVRR